MFNLQASLGCAHMERVEELIHRKREIFGLYCQSLEALPSVSINPELAGTVKGAWMPTVVFAAETGITCERLQAAFGAENGGAQLFFWPASSWPMFKPADTNTWAWDIPQRAINLPGHHDIGANDIERIIDVIKCVFN